MAETIDEAGNRLAIKQKWDEITNMMKKWKLDELDIVLLLTRKEKNTKDEVARISEYFDEREPLINEQTKDKKKQIRVLDVLGDIAQKCGDITRAVKYFQKTFDLFSSLDKTSVFEKQDKIYRTMFALLIDLMCRYEEMKNQKGINQCYQNILNLIKQNDSHRFALSDLVTNYGVLGDFWRDRRNFNEAVRFYTIGLNLTMSVAETEMDQERGTIYNGMGLAYKHNQKYGEAAQFYQKAIQAYRRKWASKPNEQLATTLANYGSVLVAMDKIEDAKKQLNEALTMGIALQYTDLVQIVQRWLEDLTS